MRLEEKCARARKSGFQKRKHIEFQRLDRLGLYNSDAGEKPKEVAVELRKVST
jgi:hypothetical protein